jgi:hypothetical protein
MALHDQLNFKVISFQSTSGEMALPLKIYFELRAISLMPHAPDSKDYIRSTCLT